MDGVSVGMKFMVYGHSEEQIEDPETGADLGVLEIPKGEGRVIHLQEKIATIISTATRQEASFGAFIQQEQRTRTVLAAFRDAAAGDFFKET